MYCELLFRQLDFLNQEPISVQAGGLARRTPPLEEQIHLRETGRRRNEIEEPYVRRADGASGCIGCLLESYRSYAPATVVPTP